VSARFLFGTWPFEGHVFPMMSIAAALRDRGDEVAFYTAEERREVVEREGFTMFPFERVDDSSWLRVASLERKVGGRRTSLRVGYEAARNWIVETIPQQVEDLDEIRRTWRPDVVVSDFNMWGPIVILREAAPVPVVAWSTLMGTQLPGPDAPTWGFGFGPPRTAVARLRARMLARLVDLAATGVRRRVDHFRALHGLPPMGCSVRAFTGQSSLYLVGSLPELDYNRRDLPSTVHYVGACVWHPRALGAEAAALVEIPTDLPWVHVTEGTSHHQDPFLLRSAVEGLAGQPVRAILTTGQSRNPEELGLGTLPPNVHLTRWVSHTELLPRCAVVVTTGGANTILASLAAGVPLVVVPTTWDKPENATRVAAAGVGVRLKAERCTPERLQAAVKQVLAKPEYRTNAQRISEALARAPGPEGAADLLQSLVPSGSGDDSTGAGPAISSGTGVT
jgi:MGT family glycosyltransferase